MAIQELSKKYKRGDVIDLDRYYYETGEHKLEKAMVAGVRTVSGDEYEVFVIFLSDGSEYKMDGTTFGMLSNPDNHRKHFPDAFKLA